MIWRLLTLWNRSSKKHALYVMQQTRNGDRHVYAMRTRFIPRDILEHFEAVNWSPQPESGATRSAPAPIDVAASMRQMWG